MMRANAIRAVGKQEYQNLSAQFKHTTLISNGVHVQLLSKEKKQHPITVLFLSRLHHKKGIIPLVNAWIKSELFQNPNYQLTIAGPDDGELTKLRRILNSLPANANLKYIGAVYGADKIELLENSHLFILPSQSEGFPTAILEAMSYGLIPIVSRGCNFPEIIDNKLAMETNPNETSILNSLNLIQKISQQEMTNLQLLNHEYVMQNYNLQTIAQQQFEFYNELLRRN